MCVCVCVCVSMSGCWPNSSARVKLTNAHEYCVESRDYANGGPIKRGDQCNWLIEVSANQAANTSDGAVKVVL